MADIERVENCSTCNNVAERRLGRPSLVRVNDWTESYNPAFGKVVRSKAHQREILAEYRDQGREFIEVGNEPVEQIHKHFDGQREAKRVERWSEPTEKIIHEALR